jgi:hypothetical protein
MGERGAAPAQAVGPRRELDGGGYDERTGDNVVLTHDETEVCGRAILDRREQGPDSGMHRVWGSARLFPTSCKNMAIYLIQTRSQRCTHLPGLGARLAIL